MATTNYDTLFKRLYPDAYNRQDGAWWWSELCILHDVSTRNLANLKAQVADLPHWERQRDFAEKYSHSTGRDATLARINRILALLVAAKLEYDL